jgi:hypothetical protein
VDWSGARLSNILAALFSLEILCTESGAGAKFGHKPSFVLKDDRDRNIQERNAMRLKNWIFVALVIGGVAVWLFLAGAAAAQRSDPGIMSPHLYTVRLENAYVRVLEYRSHPGDKEALHSPALVWCTT